MWSLERIRNARFGAFHDNWMTGDISAFARAKKSVLQPKARARTLSSN
jgi:hypothetical protein